MSFLSYGPHTGCDFKFRLTSDLFNRRRETFTSDSNSGSYSSLSIDEVETC